MKTIFQFKSIKNRLTFWFLLVALIPLIIVSAISYQQRVTAVQKRSFDKIVAIRDLKIKQINVWLNERFGDIKSFANDPEMRSLEYLFDSEPQTQKHVDIFQSIREYLSDNVIIHKAYTEAYIIDPASGQIKISTNNRIEGANRSDNPYFTEVLKTGEIYIKDIFYSKTLDKISMTISSPIRCRLHKGQHIVGVLVLRVNLDHTIYDLLGDRSGLGETGETFIVDEGMTALSKLSGYPGAPLSLKINAEPAKLASQGKIGIIKSMDYRGNIVLAAYGYIPMTQWGFVAKQDLYELNAPIRSMVLNFSLMMLLSVVGVFLLSFLLSRSISLPVHEMTDVSRKIEAGDLSARNQIFPSDELGFLAKSFNRMADFLKSQMEVQQAGAGITETMAAAKDAKDFGLKLLEALMAATRSDLGSFYVLKENHDRFEHLTSIGVASELMVDFDANNFEGEFGKVLATRQISHIEDIPEDTVFKFRTFTGTVIPKGIISIPIVIEGKVVAIISLASVKDYSSKHLDIINHSWVMALSTAYSNLLANEKTRNLADQLKEKNEELEYLVEERTKELRDREKRLRSIVENSLTGISIIQDNRVVYQNPEQESLFGPLPRSPKFIDDDSIHPEDIQKVESFYDRLSSGGIGNLEMDFRFYPKGGTESPGEMKWIYCRGSRMEYQGKEAILINIMDITRTKELEHLLRIQDKMTSLGRVATGIAHEIRNPLSGINIYLNTLDKLYERGNNKDKIKGILEHIQSASRKIEAVIKRVMDFSRPTAPTLILTNINKSVEEAISLSSVTLRKRKIKIEKILDDDLPQCYIDLQLFCDKGLGRYPCCHS